MAPFIFAIIISLCLYRLMVIITPADEQSHDAATACLQRHAILRRVSPYFFSNARRIVLLRMAGSTPHFFAFFKKALMKRREGLRKASPRPS
jgi:hypothetical protein